MKIKKSILQRNIYFKRVLFRDYPGLPSYVVLVNIGSRSQSINLTISFFDLPDNFEIVSSAARSAYRMYELRYDPLLEFFIF